MKSIQRAAKVLVAETGSLLTLERGCGAADPFHQESCSRARRRRSERSQNHDKSKRLLTWAVSVISSRHEPECDVELADVSREVGESPTGCGEMSPKRQSGVQMVK